MGIPIIVMAEEKILGGAADGDRLRATIVTDLRCLRERRLAEWTCWSQTEANLLKAEWGLKPSLIYIFFLLFTFILNLSFFFSL